MSDQMQLALRIHQRTVLVTVETARAALGLDAESVWAMIDDGQIRWAWNISVRPQGIRELRIWARELICPAPYADVNEVIAAVIGTSRPRLTSVEVARHLLLCSRQHTLDLHLAGELSGAKVGHQLYIDRESLAQFLVRRLV